MIIEKKRCHVAMLKVSIGRFSKELCVHISSQYSTELQSLMKLRLSCSKEEYSTGNKSVELDLHICNNLNCEMSEFVFRNCSYENQPKCFTLLLALYLYKKSYFNGRIFTL